MLYKSFGSKHYNFFLLIKRSIITTDNNTFLNLFQRFGETDAILAVTSY